MVFAIFLLWLFVLLGRPQDLYPQLVSLRPALLMSLITAGLVFFQIKRSHIAALFESKEVKLYSLFYLLMIFGIPFAYHRRFAFDYVILLYVSNMIVFYVFILQVNSFDRLRKVLIVMLISSLFYSIFSLIYGSFIGGRYFIYGAMFDPNDIAFVLISLFPMSIYFVITKYGKILGALAIVNILASVAVILLTASRAGTLSLFVISSMLFFTNIGKLKKSYKLLFVASIGIVALFYLDSINIERLLTITEIGEDYNVTAEQGRIHIWERSFQLILANPLTGVGVNCTPIAIGTLRDSLGLIPLWQVTHNSYVQVALEVGVIGIYVFIKLIYICVSNFNKYRKQNSSSAESVEVRNISGLILTAFIGQLVIAFFLTQAYSILFTMFFAMSVVIRKLSVRETGQNTLQLKKPIPLIRQMYVNRQPETFL